MTDVKYTQDQVDSLLADQREACAAAYESTIADPDTNPSFMATKILILNAKIDGEDDDTRTTA